VATQHVSNMLQIKVSTKSSALALMLACLAAGAMMVAPAVAAPAALVVGAGVAGLKAGADLAAKGYAVTVIEVRSRAISGALRCACGVRMVQGCSLHMYAVYAAGACWRDPPDSIPPPHHTTQARDRIGGRVWTKEVPAIGVPIEMGAQWVRLQ